MEYKYTDRLLDFIQASPSCFHVVENFAGSLSALGYTELSESQSWELRHGGKYFVRRNGSSIIALRIPKGTPSGFMMAAAHSDSPTFKVKENPEKPSDAYVQLSTEKYGGMLMATWFDRPLSVAGRIIVSEGDKLKTKLVNVDRDLLVIPSVAIHMNRSANDGMKYSAAVDTLPLYGTAEGAGSFLKLVAESVGVEKDSIVGTDLFLYCRGRGTHLGSDGELILSPKLDDLQCAFGCMEGFTASQESEAIPVCCVFDNEEVGSATKQGAASSLLRDTLRRICLSLGYGEERYRMLLAQSFLVSADNAHAKHPNHPEYSDALNCPVIGGGVVVKYNANQHYTTDGVSSAVFRSICAEAGVRVQSFANRSDMAGGSTLGSIANVLVPVKTVDIGLAQLAMHSAWETAGAQDFDDLCGLMTHYFSRSLHEDEDGIAIRS